MFDYNIYIKTLHELLITRAGRQRVRNGLRFFFVCVCVSQICTASSKNDMLLRSCLVTHVGFDFCVRNFKIRKLYSFFFEDD